MWCTHCVEDQQVVWGHDQDYIACSGCGKLFEFPVSKSHRMIGKPKKFQEKRHKHPIDNMSSTSTKSHGHELKQKNPGLFDLSSLPIHSPPYVGGLVGKRDSQRFPITLIPYWVWSSQ